MLTIPVFQISVTCWYIYWRDLKTVLGEHTSYKLKIDKITHNILPLKEDFIEYFMRIMTGLVT